jgi:hypothetical protein
MTGDSSKPLVSSIDKVKAESSPNSHDYIPPELSLFPVKKRWMGGYVSSASACYGSTQGSNLLDSPQKS